MAQLHRVTYTRVWRMNSKWCYIYRLTALLQVLWVSRHGSVSLRIKKELGTHINCHRMEISCHSGILLGLSWGLFFLAPHPCF